MKFTTSALATIAAMATLSLAAPGRVATEVGAAADVGIATDHLPVDKRTSCGHKHCGKCNGTGCKMGSGITYPCTKGKCTVQSGGGDGTPCGYDDLILSSFSDVYCPGK